MDLPQLAWEKKRLCCCKGAKCSGLCTHTWVCIWKMLLLSWESSSSAGNLNCCWMLVRGQSASAGIYMVLNPYREESFRRWVWVTKDESESHQDNLAKVMTHSTTGWRGECAHFCDLISLEFPFFFRSMTRGVKWYGLSAKADATPSHRSKMHVIWIYMLRTASY